jgi:RNA polymerase sigma factor (sigma-70 family)
VGERNKMSVGSEQELVQAALRGDPAAFAALVAPARGRAMAIVARLVGADEAEDVVQEALLRAFLGLSRLREPRRFESWLCGVAINVAKERLRSRASQARAIAAAAPTLGAAVGEDREVLDVVREALEILPAGQRDVVLMHYIDDLSCEEIAGLLGTSPGAVRVRLHRARTQLRHELAPLAPVPFPTQTKELPMVDVKVDDVVVRVAADDASKIVEQAPAVIVLKEKKGMRSMPIFVGLPEGEPCRAACKRQVPSSRDGRPDDRAIEGRWRKRRSDCDHKHPRAHVLRADLDQRRAGRCSPK